MPQVNNPTGPNLLVAALAHKVKATLRPEGPSPASVLEWAATQDADTIRAAILATQPRGWNVALEPLVDSLSPDQRVGMLTAFIAVWVQTQ